MASASVCYEPNETRECSVCHELFTEPKLLPCGHHLCRRCLVSWMKIQEEAHCPLCQTLNHIWGLCLIVLVAVAEAVLRFYVIVLSCVDLTRFYFRAGTVHLQQLFEHNMTSVSLRAHPHERECSVCHELFTEPKLLPCGHLLCRHCLVSWMEIQEEALCPLCWCAIIEGEQPGLQSMEDIADGFPTDLAMEELVEAQRLLNKGHYCCVCEDVAAVSVCLNCRDMLCKACKKAHGKLSMSKDHIVEDLSSLTAEKLAANSPSTCADHSEEMPRLYCCTHGASICLLCASSKHRNCPEVMDLEEKAEEARAKLAELTASLSAGETELERAISQLDQHLQDTEERTQAAIVEMEETCYRLESAVKACRHQWRELALSTCSDVKESVHAEKNCLLKRRRKLTSHKHVAQRVEGMKTGHVVSTMTSVMETRVTELDCSAPLPAIAEVVSTVTMIIDPQVVSTIERGLAALGKVKGVPFEIVADMKKWAAISFHDNHGANIVLSNNKQTAEYAQGYGDGVVMLRDPMEVNMLYEVRVDKWQFTFEVNVSDPVAVGVVTQSPDDVTLPDWSRELESAVAVGQSWVKDCGSTEVKSSLAGSALKSLHVGRRVGVSLDSDHCLHLHVDGQRHGIIARLMTQPCYAMFDLAGYTRQVTLLPLTPLSE